MTPSSRKNLEDRVSDFEHHTYEKEVYEEETPRESFERRRAARNLHTRDIYPRSDRDEPVYQDVRTRYVGNRSRKQTWMFIGGTSLIVTVVALLTFVFNSTTITITPRFEDLKDISKVYMLSTTEQPGTLAYTLASSTLSKSKTLPLSETKMVETKASGKIIVYNNHDAEPQRLIKNTRFESSAGKIYRINQSITVPGKKGDTPGSVEVTVYADEAGASYNSSPTDFTIPGFKGTDREKTFFARSNGALTGGASGNVALVSPSVLNAAKDELALELTESLKKTLAEVRVDGKVTLLGATKVIITDNEQALLSGETATYTATAVGYIPLVENFILAQALASHVRDYAQEPVRVDYVDTLTFSTKEQGGTTLGTEQTTEVLIEGSPRIVWLLDEPALKESLRGKSKKEFQAIMSEIDAVLQADISPSPMWLSDIPDGVAKIFIEEELKKR